MGNTLENHAKPQSRKEPESFATLRETNWDVLFFASPLQERGYLFAVADGMGGYRDGHEASQASLTTLYKQFYSAPITSLPDAIQSANMAVRRL
jgi:serine/threonine protein phosphatase PrpC